MGKKSNHMDAAERAKVAIKCFKFNDIVHL